MAKATLSTIAKHANVSIATVSRVLKKPHLTSPLTQSKVYQTIQELNIATYDNVDARSNTNESKKILIIDNQLITHSLINYGLEQVLKLAEYQFFYIRFPYSDNHDIHHLISYLTQNLFAGIVVINDAPYLKTLSQYASNIPPIILVNHFSLDFNCVYFDHLTIAHQITKYFIDHSHNKIAILLSHYDKLSSTHFLQGYQQALHRADIAIETNYIIRDCFTYEHGRLAVKNLLNSNKPPTAFICADNSCLNYTDEKYFSEQHFHSRYHSVLGALDQINESQQYSVSTLALAYISHSQQRQYNELDRLNRINKPLYKMGQQAAILLCEILKLSHTTTKRYQLIETEPIFY